MDIWVGRECSELPFPKPPLLIEVEDLEFEEIKDDELVVIPEIIFIGWRIQNSALIP